ncbi:MAG TPA: hypothetical protein VJW51_04065 [Candidatus Acidoferrales bacterium]|nr:hypothetical protein [Candidatus Acidoferrales bacterium]
MNELSLKDVRGHGLSTPLIVTVVLAAAGIMWAAPRAVAGDYRDLLTAFVILQSLWIVLFWRMGAYMLRCFSHERVSVVFRRVFGPGGDVAR